MKKSFLSHSLFFITVILLLLSCSRKKDKFLNRNWHAMTTYYNTLYNGVVSFDEGREGLVQQYQDNYWKQLPVERLEIRENDINLSDGNSNPEFARAEEKAAKAIQKHAMVINNREVNHQIDESFMLLGKARYFDQRFIQALEAFNYILYKYPTCNNITNARIWKAKVHMRLDNNEAAVKSLKKIIPISENKETAKNALNIFSSKGKDTIYKYKHLDKKLNLTKQEIADATSILAQAYINLKHKDSAIEPMKIALEYTTKNEERGRYHYILGQLYNRVRERDSANLEFDKIIKLNRRIPREYLINAYLAKARNLEIESDDQVAFLEILNKLEKNWENRPFLDKIYYEKAIFYFSQDSMALAENFYEKSLRTNTPDEYLRSLSYESLGKIKFRNQEYKKSGAYMDSTLQLLGENSKRYRVIKKKRDNLEGVIKYEGITKNTDSILYLSSLTKAAQLEYFQNYTDSLKEIKAAAIKLSKSKRAKLLQTVNPTIAARSRTANSTAEQQFYFYNSNTLSNGKLQFEGLFGKRDLVDYWKVSSLNSFSNAVEAIEEIEEDYDIDKDPKFDPKLYIAKIPADKKILDSISKDRNEAYYQLGIIYKEQLKEYGKAVDKFESLLANNPAERYVLPTKYNLYKIYQSVGNTLREDRIRKDIMDNHPDSRYAAIVKDPFVENLAQDENSLESTYAQIYKDYQQQKYHSVLNKLESQIERYQGDPLVVRFELLKALSLGKAYGVSKMKPSLKYLSETFPLTDEGKKAAEILETTVPHLEKLKFEEDTSGTRKYKLLYDFVTSDTKNALEFKTKLDTVIKKRNFNYLKTSVDFYSKDTLFVLIHGLRGKQQVRGMNSLLTDKDLDDPVQKNGLFVSTENYRVIQAQKKYNQYLQKKDSIY